MTLDPHTNTRGGSGKRLFLALWPDKSSLETLSQFQEANILRSSARAIDPARLHMTLVFLGMVSDEKEALLRSRLPSLKLESFRLRFDNLMFRKKQKMIWLGLSEQSEPLLDLVTRLRRCVSGCGIETEDRAFTGHITLARKVDHFNNEGVLTEPVSWLANEITLVESRTCPTGAEYKILLRIGLAPLGKD